METDASQEDIETAVDVCLLAGVFLVTDVVTPAGREKVVRLIFPADKPNRLHVYGRAALVRLARRAGLEVDAGGLNATERNPNLGLF